MPHVSSTPQFLNFQTLCWTPLDSTPLDEYTDRSLLHECLLAPPTTGHHLIVHTWE